MDVTRVCISCILELREVLLSFQTGFNPVSAAVVCATQMSHFQINQNINVTLSNWPQHKCHTFKITRHKCDTFKSTKAQMWHFQLNRTQMSHFQLNQTKRCHTFKSTKPQMSHFQSNWQHTASFIFVFSVHLASFVYNPLHMKCFVSWTVGWTFACECVIWWLEFHLNFFPTHCTLWDDRKFFPSNRVSHWWTISTASFVDALHTGVRH